MRFTIPVIQLSSESIGILINVNVYFTQNHCLVIYTEGIDYIYKYRR